VAAALKPGRIPPGIENPIATAGSVGEFFRFLDSATTFSALPAFVACAVGLAVRFRGARGVERQQLKWFTYAAALVAVGFAGSLVVPGGLLADLLFLVGLLALASLPLAASIAILRYRLYDIDDIINRTLVYGALTAALALAYVGCVLVLQRALDSVTTDSDLAVAGSTIAVAALFGPLRARIQGFIDRRFYRSKYDATQTLESFSARLRDEVDLQTLTQDLVEVVDRTMEPRHVSLWLQPSTQFEKPGPA
jgi:hypothetical protein